MELYEANGNRFAILDEQEQMNHQIEVDGFIMHHQNQQKFQLINLDSSIAHFSGNGIHCYYHYLVDHQQAGHEHLLQCKDRMVKVKLISKNPFISQIEIPLPQIHHNQIEMGNTHKIYLDQSETLAQEYCKQYNANISYISEISSKMLRVKTYERGVGWTKSCGSGAIACAYYCFIHGLCESNVEVINDGGNQIIQISDVIKHTTQSQCLVQKVNV